MRGLRVHITGSAAIDCNAELLRSAHGFVHAFTRALIDRGGGLVLGVGGEPRGDSGEACTFDWTALDVVASFPDPAPGWPVLRRERFVVVSSQRGLQKVPTWRLYAWQACRNRKDFALKVTTPGWRMAGVIRERQVLSGDVLLVLGGGAGAEHLAELYLDEGKSVIPIHTELGAISSDGSGGGSYLQERALTETPPFFKLREGAGNSTARLLSLRLTMTNADALSNDTINLITDLRAPRAFYVRLLRTEHPDFPKVERFFRQVVDPVIEERNFTRHEVGRDQPEAAFANVEVFAALHRSSLALVDLTAVRPNCTMELGYALARRRRVVLSAMRGTPLPFDADKLPTYEWDEIGPLDERMRAYRDWFDRYIDLPPLVE